MPDMGLKLFVDGEQSFKQAMADIAASMKLANSEMKLAQSEYAADDKSKAAVTARTKALNDQIEAQRDKVAVLAEQLKRSNDEFGEGSTQSKKYEAQLNDAQAALNKMEHEQESSAKTTHDWSAALSKAGDVLKAIGAVAATAFAAMGAAVVGATKQLADFSVQTAAYADDILTMSSTTGMATDKLQELSYMAELVDVSVDTVAKSMAKNTKSMASARTGTGATAEAYKQLGIAVTDSAGNLRDGETVYWEAIDALGKIENETERDAVAMQLFGKSAKELNPLIEAGSAKIAELTEEAHKMGYVLSDKQLAEAGAFDDTIQRLKSGSEAAKHALGTVLMPQLNALGTTGVDLLGQFTQGLIAANGDMSKMSKVIGDTLGQAISALMEQLPAFIQLGLDIVTAVGTAIIDNLPVIVEGAVQIVNTLLEGIIQALPALMTGAVELLSALVQGIVENLPALMDAATQMVTTLVQGLAEAMPTLIPAAVEAVLTICQGLLDNLPALLEAALQLVLGLAQGLIDAIPVIVERLPEIIQAIVSFIVESLPIIIQAGLDLFMALIGALPEIITGITGALPEIISAIVTTLLDNLPLLVDAGFQLIGGLIKGLVGAVPELLKSMGQVCKDLIYSVLAVFGIHSPSTVFADMGTNLLKGLWNGIADAKQWLMDKLKQLGHDVINYVKGLFGIHSPSAVFRDQIGENLALGLGEGFSDTMDSVAKDMARSIPTEFDTAVNMTANGITQAAQDLSPAQAITVSLNVGTFINQREGDLRTLADEIGTLISANLQRRQVVMA
jgi:phage-related protein